MKAIKEKRALNEYCLPFYCKNEKKRKNDENKKKLSNLAFGASNF